MMIRSLAIGNTYRVILIIGPPMPPSRRIFFRITDATYGNARNAAGFIFGTRKAGVILLTVEFAL